MFYFFAEEAQSVRGKAKGSGRAGEESSGKPSATCCTRAARGRTSSGVQSLIFRKRCTECSFPFCVEGDLLWPPRVGEQGEAVASDWQCHCAGGVHCWGSPRQGTSAAVCRPEKSPGDVCCLGRTAGNSPQGPPLGLLGTLICLGRQGAQPHDLGMASESSLQSGK